MESLEAVATGKECVIDLFKHMYDLFIIFVIIFAFSKEERASI